MRGIFDVGYYEFNASFIVDVAGERAGPVRSGRHRARTDGDAATIPDQAPAVQAAIARGARAAITPITTWMEENSTLLNALMVEKNVMFYLLFFIVIVAAFVHPQRAHHVRRPEDPRDRHAQGAGRDPPAGRGFCSSARAPSSACWASSPATAWACWRVAYRNEFLHFMHRATGIELFPASIYGFSELPALIIAGRHRVHLRQFAAHLHAGRRDPRAGRPAG